MKTIIILITIVIATTTTSCKKDTTTICENLLEQGSADATFLKGEWEFEYFAYSPNGKRIKKNEEILDSSMEIKDICDTNSNDTCYMYVYSVNSIRYIYTPENNNGISFNINISTEIIPSEEEIKLTNALANVFCYVIKDNELLLHYKEDDYENNILILKKILHNTIWVYYDETKCADPWGIFREEKEKEKIEAIKEYFKDKGIKIFAVEITEDGTFDLNDNCGDRSGNRFKCKIKESDLSKMEKEGFYQ